MGLTIKAKSNILTTLVSNYYKTRANRLHGRRSWSNQPLAVSQTDMTFSFLLVQAAIVFLLSSADIVNELLGSVCKAALRKE